MGIHRNNMLSLETLKALTIREFDSRNLKSRVRYNALNHVIDFIKSYYNGDTKCLERNKNDFCQAFVEQTGYVSNAGRAAINELYNQYHSYKGTEPVILPSPAPVINRMPKCNTESDTLCECMEPLVDNESEILILGTMPGGESLRKQQYYSSPNNAFWKIIAALYNDWKALTSYEEKKECIRKNHIALWDVYQSCNRIKSADASIDNQVNNDIEGLLEKYPSIKKIILNGNKAAEHFHASIPYYKAISTAAYVSVEDKVSQWKELLIKE